MNLFTYSLELEYGNSKRYYDEIETLSYRILQKGLMQSDNYLIDFMKFIKASKIEILRTKEEYFIELLLIGIFIEEYKDHARAFRNMPGKIFLILNNLRKKEKFKIWIDLLRGKLISRVLLKKVNELNELSLEDIILIIKWLKASGDFDEEVIRLNNWKVYLENKNKSYIQDMLEFCHILSKNFYEECKCILGKYTKVLSKHLDTYKERHFNKEDIIYCGKGEIQYFYNMVSAQIMNTVFREKFLNSSEKYVFLPACMRQTKGVCLSNKTTRGYECVGCFDECNVNKLRKVGQAYNFKVYVIPHETLLSNLEKDENINTGMVGIACVTNLISGGWKAIRLGFIPQCVVLNNVGCSKHWLEQNLMTNIDIEKFKSLFN
ncbi:MULTISPECIES: DUF116 domain-containing protein [unclassified Clostridium]|uniref:DUF116 domain-containing protein n=1 Tax=unclassified Clostridium TaxID=2614128 RepID=UPI000297DC66|nr:MULTISPECIES: DUF116 domain-containing protein [unclassified Clostridium]EKQ57134.1 MAG: hypothetical protein A370_01234 [Clostridium sp. Maddingley MBC34-26]